MIDLDNQPFFFNGNYFPADVDGRPILATRRDIFGPEVIDVSVAALSWVDDDLRVRINGVTVSDTQWCSVWYSGDTFITKQGVFTPDFTASSRWRRLRLDAAAIAAALGRAPRAGDVIAIDAFDGWAASWQAPPCDVIIRYDDGTSQATRIGVLASGTSAGVNTPPGVDQFVRGPHFFTYYPIGTVTILPDQYCRCAEAL